MVSIFLYVVEYVYGLTDEAKILKTAYSTSMNTCHSSGNVSRPELDFDQVFVFAFVPIIKLLIPSTD